MKTMAMLAAAVLCAGCGTVRFGAELTRGCQGPDGMMATVRIGAPAVVCMEGVPAEPQGRGEEDPPGTWVGRQMVAAADWTVQHPGWAAFIAGATALVAAGEAQDWWGLFGEDDDGGGGAPKTDGTGGSDREVEIDQTGRGNVAEVSVVQDVGAGPRPNVAIRQDGDGNVARIRFEPAE